MKSKKKFLTLAFILISLASYSQKSRNPEKLDFSDFISSKKSYQTIIFQHNSVKYPFKVNPAKAGARSSQFLQLTECFVRLKLSNTSSDNYLKAAFNADSTLIYIQSATKYTLSGGKIKSVKIKDRDIRIDKQDSLIIFNLSNITGDSVAIVDLKYSVKTPAKQNILICLDRQKEYEDFLTRIEIPEIFEYESVYFDKRLNLETEKEKTGDLIGYRSFGLNPPFTAVGLHDFILRNPNMKVDFQQVNYKIKSYIYSANNLMPEVSLKDSSFGIDLKLIFVNEIK